jgi:hypothetical protein
MKRNLKILFIAVLLTAAPVLMIAQAPPHPNGGSGPGSGNQTVGSNNGAPVGNGTFILFALALAYAGRKVYGMRTAAEE